jgi:hypothetical protein
MGRQQLQDANVILLEEGSTLQDGKEPPLPQALIRTPTHMASVKAGMILTQESNCALPALDAAIIYMQVYDCKRYLT